MATGFEVLHGGILTLVQDRGRFGYNAIGVTNSGVMDEFAYIWANRLLQNSSDANCLEILYSGLKLKATDNITISVTGANLGLTINGMMQKPWQTYNIKTGDIIAFSKTITGQRAYLAVKGGFTLEKSFGSYSTTLKEKLGGLNGTAIKKGDFLPFEANEPSTTNRLKEEYWPNYEKPLRLRVVLSYQEDAFSKKEKKRFFNSEYVISNDNNRMGIKLQGEAIKSKLHGIVSEGISFGAIQIPKDGQPIILLKDRQTIGGYPKIGSVLPIDCFALSQLKPGMKVQFEEIGLKKAQKKMKKFYEGFET